MMTTSRLRRFSPPRRARRGQSLVEFALVALVVYLLFAAIIEFGRLFFGAQTIQSVADFAARELSRAPISATGPDPANINTQFLLNYYLCTGDQTADPDVNYVRTYIYTEDRLAIDLTNWKNGSNGQSLIEYIDSLTPAVPPVNKLLLPLMFVDSVPGSGTTGQTIPLLRYPGALVQNHSTHPASSGYTIKVPVVYNRTPTEQGVWHNVIEAVPFTDSSGTQHDVFSATSGSTGSAGVPAGGLAAVRVNYPFQAATMVSYPYNPNQPFVIQSDPSTFRVINPNPAGEATSKGAFQLDAGVSILDPNNFLNGGTPVAPNSQPGFYAGTYGGTYGLGEMGAVNMHVRPFRKTITCQAIYRREVFGASPSP